MGNLQPDRSGGRGKCAGLEMRAKNGDQSFVIRRLARALQYEERYARNPIFDERLVFAGRKPNKVLD